MKASASHSDAMLRKHVGNKGIKPHAHVKVNGLNLKATHAITLDACTFQGHSVVQPSTSLNSAFFANSGNTIDFQINSRDLVLKGMTLSLNVTNSDAVNVMQFLPHRLIERIEFHNASGVFYTTRADDIFNSLIHLSSESYEKVRGGLNLTSAYGVGTALAVSTQANYLISCT